MATPSLALVVVPADTRLWSADLAGRPVRDYVLERLRAITGAEAWTVAPGDVVPGGGCDAETRLLIVDARAWVSEQVVRAALDAARAETRDLRVVDDAGPPRTLVVVTRAGAERAEALRGGGRVDQTLLAATLHAGADGADVIMRARDWDRAPGPLWLDSWTGLAEIERMLLVERAHAVMADGVRVRDPWSLYVRGALMCGSGVELDVGVVIEGTVVLGDDVRIGAYATIRDAQIGAGTHIRPYSMVEGATIGAGSFVGPYGRLRPGAVIGSHVQVGNYVEIKNSRIGDGSRINHHSFIGDAELADRTTIGAGTITCNHDGTESARTVIETGAYIGSGCNLVAPLRIGEGATIGAGSTITEDVAPGTLTLARTRQTTITQWRGPRSRRSPQ